MMTSLSGFNGSDANSCRHKAQHLPSVKSPMKLSVVSFPSLRALLFGVALATLLVASQAAAQGTDPISGAQLGPSGPRQAAHAVLERPDRAGRRHEFSIPGMVQINNTNTQHYGTGLNYRYHLSETFALNLGGSWYAYNSEAATKAELIARVQKNTMGADSLLLKWDAHLGLEATPLYGKLSFFSLGVVHFGFYLGAGMGLADTRLQLMGPNSKSPDVERIYGETGLRPTAQFSGGLRVFLGRYFALRFEVKDVITSSEVNRINGCSLADQNAGVDTGTCDLSSIPAGVAESSFKEVLAQGHSNLLNTVSFVGAVSVIF